MDTSPIGYPRTSLNPGSMPARQHVITSMTISASRLLLHPPRPTSPSQLPPHTARHRGNDYTPLITHRNIL